jgi:chitin disaccharide deacetylase
MERFAIVNGDDFGLSPGVNRGIIQAHREGILTSTSLMATGDAFGEAVGLAQDHPRLSIGIHLALVEGRPVSAPERIPSLVTSTGTFGTSLGAFMMRWLSGRIRRAEVERELTAQVEKVLASGLAVEKLDSHMHLHLLPGIFPIAVALARRYRIRGIRLPRERMRHNAHPRLSTAQLKRAILTSLAVLYRPHAVKAELVCPDRFRGIMTSGHLSERDLLSTLATLPPGVTEVMVHPGYRDAVLEAWPSSRVYAREMELEALTSPAIKEFVATSDIHLINFADVGKLFDAAKE